MSIEFAEVQGMRDIDAHERAAAMIERAAKAAGVTPKEMRASMLRNSAFGGPTPRRLDVAREHHRLLDALADS